MNVSNIAEQIRLRVEDKDGVTYTSNDIILAIDSANQRIGAYLDKKYLSRLLHEQKLNTFFDHNGTAIVEGKLHTDNQFLTNYQYAYPTNFQTPMSSNTQITLTATQKASIWKGYFLLSDLTENTQKNQFGYELLFDQIESAYLIPNDHTNYGAKVNESIVWIHLTDQLGRYELENSYMYTPQGESPVFVRTSETKRNGEHEVKYLILPKDLPMFGDIQLIYYRKPNKISNLGNQEPEIASVAHDALVFLACAELLHSDGENQRSQSMHQKGLEIIGALNAKVGNMDVTKKQSNI
jgi:hypothetical protein